MDEQTGSISLERRKIEVDFSPYILFEMMVAEEKSALRTTTKKARGEVRAF